VVMNHFLSTMKRCVWTVVGGLSALVQTLRFGRCQSSLEPLLDKGWFEPVQFAFNHQLAM
jgi:hypothetical protein